MPKLVDKYSRYKQQTEEYEAEIFGAIGRRRLRHADIAKALGKSRSAVTKKLNDIDRLTLGELRSLASYLGLEVRIGEKSNDKAGTEQRKTNGEGESEVGASGD